MKIFLVGFMGCGKSHWGKIWAEHGKLPFVELDILIEEREHKTIATVFEEKGEPYFRKVESDVLKSYTRGGSWIMSAGGGTPCFFDNMEWMNQQGTTVYLKASPQLLAQRLFAEKDQRPVLKNVPDSELENFITKKLEEREVFYNKARFVVNAATINVSSISALQLA